MDDMASLSSALAAASADDTDAGPEVGEPTAKDSAMLQDIKSMISVLESLQIPGIAGSNKDSGTTRMRLFVNTATGSSITVELEPASTVELLKAQILDRRSRLTVAGKQMENGHTLKHYNVVDMCSIDESGRLDGGVKKLFLKREEAPKVLKAELRNLIKSQAVEVNEHTDIDENIVAALRSFQDKIDAMKVLRASGVQVIASGLKQLRDEDISMLSEIMTERKGRNGMLMEKIPRAIEHAYPLMRKMRDSMAALTNKQEEVRGVLLDIMAEEYILYEGGTVSLDTASLKDDIKKELIRRGTLKSIGHVEEPIDNGIGCALL